MPSGNDEVDEWWLYTSNNTCILESYNNNIRIRDDTKNN